MTNNLELNSKEVYCVVQILIDLDLNRTYPSYREGAISAKKKMAEWLNRR